MSKRLELTTYQLKLTDPRVKRRLEKVLPWCAQKLVGTKRGRSVGWEEVHSIFGNESSQLTVWLRANLLQQTGTYEARKGKKKSYNSYTLKRSGYEKVCRLMGQEAPSEAELLRRKYADVLNGTPLEYKDRGLRRYHEIQNIRRETRKALFEGWWDYDIEACAPTLVHQYAANQHRLLHGDGPEPFPAVALMVNKKEAVRQQVAELTGFEARKTKELLTMLLFRARANPHHNVPMFAMFGCDRQRLDGFLADPFISQFRSDVEAMWELAFQHDDRERSAAGKRPSTIKDKAKRRMNVYLTLERRVIDAMPLAIDGGNLVLMHDGFMSRDQIDVPAFEAAVKDKTGFVVRLAGDLLKDRDEADIEPDVFDVMKGIVVDDADETD